MAEKNIRNGRVRSVARDGYGGLHTDGHYEGMNEERYEHRSCPASRSLDRVQRFYSDPGFQVPDWQPRD